MGVFDTQEIQFSDEGGLFENAATPASNTWSTRIPVLSVESPPPEQDRQTDGAPSSRQNDSRPGYLGRRAATFGFTAHLGGHCGTAAAGLTETWPATLIGDGLGGLDVSGVGGTVGAGATTTSVPYAGATIAAGDIIRVGARGDGRADGQAAVVGAVGGGAATLLNALPGAPALNDVIYATQLCYPLETLGTSKRFLRGWTDTGEQYHFMGCHMSALGLRFAEGELPTFSPMYVAAYGAKYAVAIPSVSPAISENETAPISGTLHYQTVGTATRNLLAATELELTLDLGLAIKEGPAAGKGAYQAISGYGRLRCIPTLSMLVPIDEASDALYDADGPDTTFKRFLFTGSTTDGRAVGFHLPRAFLVGPRPTYESYNGLLYKRLIWRGREGTLVTNDKTKAAVQIFMG